MSDKYKFGFSVLALLMTTSNIAQAQENNSPLSIAAGIGFEYDSNLTVDAVDSTSNIGDTAFNIEAGIAYDIIDEEDRGFTIGYDYYNSFHNDLDEFDIRIHGLNVENRFTVGDVDLGLNSNFSFVGLGGDAFMNIQSFRPNIGYLTANNNVYLLGAYEYQRQTFKDDTLKVRDAKRHSGSLKAIFLLDEGRSLTTGYTFSDHNAEDSAYDYTGHTFDVSLKVPFEVFSRETVFRTGYSYNIRDFTEDSLNVYEEERFDKRHSITSSIVMPFGDGYKGRISYEFIRSDSTLESIDFDEHIVTTGVDWEF